ncbi:MAG TPA: FAD:protein FMN transferase [Balneolaceae bacterium]|nr:FAD:protein FMN transferase [Balneolaceae bacterium]
MNNSLTVQLACHAMATRFEFVLCGSDEVALRAAGEEAIREIRRIESKFSFYNPTSVISKLNARAGYESVRTDPETFHFIQQASLLSKETNGTFDPTIAPLMRAWGLIRNSDTPPDHKKIEEAKNLTGMSRVILDESDGSVRYETPGMQFDPGSLGKGYALDQVALLLKELGVEHALVHGGTSSVVAWGKPPGEHNEWKVAVELPEEVSFFEKEFQKTPTRVFALDNQSLSVSAIWGKTAEDNGKTVGHVIDPRSGKPVESALLAACITDSATTADAYSTAMLVMHSEAAAFADENQAITDYYIVLANGEILSSNSYISNYH